MALKRNETYPGRFNNPTTEHPQGAFKNRSAPGAQDGSYLEQQWANDWDGFFGRLLTLAGVTPNGTVDTAQASQYYDALKSLFLQRTNPFADIKADGTVDTALSNLQLGEAAKLNVGTASGTVAAGNDSRFNQQVGVSQAWQDMTAQRQLGVTYTNTTGRPIQVLLDFIRPAAPASWNFGVKIDSVAYPNGGGSYCPIIPPGSTYSVLSSGVTQYTWRELR